MTLNPFSIDESDVAVLMGVDPQKSEQDLLKEKSSYKKNIADNALSFDCENMKHKILGWVNDIKNLKLKPNYFENKNHSHFKTFVDGFDKEKSTVCSIKIPKQKLHQEIITYSPVFRFWYFELQWQMKLSSSNRAVLAVWGSIDEKCDLFDILPCYNVQQEMEQKAMEFYDRVTKENA